MRPKKQKYKNIKQHKRWQRKGILTKRLLENQRVRVKPETGNQKLFPYKMMPKKSRKRYLKSQLLIKRSSSRIQHSYHEESCHLIKWYRCLKSNVGAKTYAFCKGQNSQKPTLFIGFLEVPLVYAYKKPGATPPP